MSDRDEELRARLLARLASMVEQLEQRVHEIREDSTRCEGRVDELVTHVSNLRESHAHVEEALMHLVRDRELTAHVATNQMLADLEVKKAASLSVIKERDADLDLRRSIRKELAMKLLTVAMAAWAIIASAISARC